MLASSRWMGLVALLAFKKTISLTHHAFSQTSPPPAANQAAFLCSFPVLWQLSPAALDFTHQNLYNKIKYYRFCGKEVRSWISPANTASIPCAYRAAIPGNGEPRQIPIVQSTTFKYDSSDDMGKLFDLQASGYFYSRLQNPTCDTVAAKIAELEGGTAAMLTGSGQAANFFALFNICNAGDHIVSSSCHLRRHLQPFLRHHGRRWALTATFVCA